jgi:putative transposase
MLYFQSLQSFTSPQFYTKQYAKKRYFESGATATKVASERHVELVSFCLMDNHFHLILKEKTSGGISRYMQRLQNAYTKYYNTRHKLSGHLFQGPYQAVHVSSDEQLMHLSAYIHRNPLELRTNGHRVSISSCAEYEWSSYQDYTVQNRWGDLLLRNVILERFSNPADYASFLKSSPAKESQFTT